MIDKKSFAAMLIACAEKIFAERRITQNFVIDDNNKEVINQMYLYLIADENCKWNINKGIYLMGKIGCGKSVLMYAFLEILGKLTRHIITTVHAKMLFEMINSKGIDYLKSRPMMIDELGRENIEIANFGTKIKPVIDLFAIRYEEGARTFCTSNFTLETLESNKDNKGKVIEVRYGNFITSRMKEMMNIVVLPGDSRRQKFEII
jgi:DNA replication protein DnaC